VKKVATCAVLKKLAKENNRPRGENSPNLVTLVVSEEKCKRLQKRSNVDH
jgi:hypothetical protein